MLLSGAGYRDCISGLLAAGCEEGLGIHSKRALSMQPPIRPCQPRRFPSATICLPCASISRCYGNRGFQGNS